MFIETGRISFLCMVCQKINFYLYLLVNALVPKGQHSSFLQSVLEFFQKKTPIFPGKKVSSIKCCRRIMIFPLVKGAGGCSIRMVNQSTQIRTIQSEGVVKETASKVKAK